MSVNTVAMTPEEITQLFDTPGVVADNTFEIALVLGGTVSSGAYTAGVLDFLIEALDAWTTARDGKVTPPVPGHKVMLRFIAGTSGGGVNAAIAARALAYDFPHVSQRTAAATAAGNPFYDTWINRLTLDGMLGTDDLDAVATGQAVSLLDGSVIDGAAAKLVAYTAPALKPRSYLGEPLRLILTVTNLTGVSYRIDLGAVTQADGSVVNLHQSYVDHADYARFAFVYPGTALATPRPDEMVLGFGNTPADAADWSRFGGFAMGTAAFPIGFPPRLLTRPLEHYRYRVISVPGDTDPNAVTWLPLVADWQAIGDWAGGGLPDDYTFLAVDGGATDNEPIELARTALAGIGGRNPRDGMKANRGVVLIDPFAGAALMAPPADKPVLPDLAEGIVNAVLQQTRYDTRDLLLAAYPDVYSRFMITALRDGKVGDDALATAGLGAFIGFASAAFRRHDYLLGRKNCQDFLRNQFVLPRASPVFANCLTNVPLDDYLFKDETGEYLPIIPLVGAPRLPEVLDPWPKNALDPTTYHGAIGTRFAGVLKKEVGGSGPLSSVLIWVAAKVGAAKVADTVVAAMQAALKASDLA